MATKSFRTKVNNKLRGNAGESITETLVSLLISALALAMLAGVIAAGARMIDRQKKKLDEYYGNNEAIVNMTEAGSTVTATFVFDENGSNPSVNVNLYTNDAFENKPVISYKAQ